MFDICINLHLKDIYSYGKNILLFFVKIIRLYSIKSKNICSIIASWVIRGTTKTRDRMGLAGIGRDPVPGFSIWHYWIPCPGF